jgi:DNA-binding CsgD family transcriptional regulator
MASKKGKSRLRKAEAKVKQRVEDLDEDIQELESLLIPYDRIKEEINKLRAARRALMGGNRVTGSGGTRVRQEDVVEYLRENPGSSAGEIAKGLGTDQPVVSSHLNRGKNERFLMKDKRWWLRSPKDGIKTVDDLDDVEEKDDD